MNKEGILVIAFDGLDYELINEYDLRSIKMEEFGMIDNDTGINERGTSELFASFITGKTHSEHGVDSLNTYTDKKKGKIVDILSPNIIRNRVPGFYRFSRALEWILGTKRKRYEKEDWEEETLFEEIENSKAMFVPSYNPSLFWLAQAGIKPVQFGHEPREIMEHWDGREYRYRKNKLFRDINHYFDFLMCHFHRPDFHHHMQNSTPETYEEGELEYLYKETGKLASKILEEFRDSYETIIFMSDHGLPEEGEHNKKAFYSCNKELFGDKKPHITDFYDEIMSRAE